MIIGPSHIAAIDGVINLSSCVFLADYTCKGLGNIIHMHMLVQCESISTDEDRLAFFDSVDPREVPADLSQHSLHRTIRRGWLDDDRGKFLMMIRRQIDIICRDLVSSIFCRGAQRMSLIAGEVVVFDPIGTNGRCLHEPTYPAKGAYTGCSIFCV